MSLQDSSLTRIDGIRIIQSEDVMPGYRRTDACGGILINPEDYGRLRIKPAEEILLALGQMREEFEEESKQ